MAAQILLHQLKFVPGGGNPFGAFAIFEKVTSGTPPALQFPFVVLPSSGQPGVETLVGVATYAQLVGLGSLKASPLNAFVDPGDGGAHPDISTIAIANDTLRVKVTPFEWNNGGASMDFTVGGPPALNPDGSPFTPIPGAIYITDAFPRAYGKPGIDQTGLPWEIWRTILGTPTLINSSSGVIGYGWIRRAFALGANVLSDRFTSVFVEATDALTHITATQYRMAALVRAAQVSQDAYLNQYGGNPIDSTFP